MAVAVRARGPAADVVELAARLRADLATSDTPATTGQLSGKTVLIP